MRSYIRDVYTPPKYQKNSCIFGPFTGICVIGTRLGPADLLVLRFVKLYLCGSAGRLKHWTVCRTVVCAYSGFFH